MKKIILLLMFVISVATLSQAQTTKLEPKGIYKEIDVARHNRAITILNGNDKALKQQILDSVLKNPNSYNPPVIYAISRQLYGQEKKDEAAYWFYLAQLRARYDANLCMDKSAKQAVSVLNNEYGPEINKYAFHDIDKLEKTVTKVVEFVKTNEENYDHRWINLHGMDATLSAMDESTEKHELTQAKNMWPEIKKKTIDDYYNGFIEYAKSIKK